MNDLTVVSSIKVICIESKSFLKLFVFEIKWNNDWWKVKYSANLLNYHTHNIETNRTSIFLKKIWTLNVKILKCVAEHSDFVVNLEAVITNCYVWKWNPIWLCLDSQFLPDYVALYD